MNCRSPSLPILPGLLLVFAGAASLQAQTPLHQRIDAAILQKYKGPLAKPATDGELIRRLTLDLAGVIPAAPEVRQYLADSAPDKWAKLVDRLLDGPDFPRRMQEFVHVMLEERRSSKDRPLVEWEEYLLKSFAERKPWDQLMREILTADPDDPGTKPAARFYLDRGGDAHLLTRDVGRLLLGRDVECSRCHDHPTIKDYTQADYYGLYAFLYRTVVFRKGKDVVLAEKVQPGKVDFESVFVMKKMQTGPHLPGGVEIEEPTFPKGQEYVDPPNAKAGKPGRPKYKPWRRAGSKSYRGNQGLAFRSQQCEPPLVFAHGARRGPPARPAPCREPGVPSAVARYLGCGPGRVQVRSALVSS